MSIDAELSAHLDRPFAFAKVALPQICVEVGEAQLPGPLVITPLSGLGVVMEAGTGLVLSPRLSKPLPVVARFTGDRVKRLAPAPAVAVIVLEVLKAELARDL